MENRQRKKGKTIHSEAREIVRKVISECDAESRQGTLQYNIKQSNLRASQYTGVPVRTISRIRREGVEAGESRKTQGESRG